MTKWSLQDAKNRFSEVVVAAKRAPQTVTKHGKRAVVIVDAGEYDRLTEKTRKPDKPQKNFIEHLLSMPMKDGFEFERRKPKRRAIEL
ncbi:MAG TPA: type II toxin-antitoxin system Phd/YefM family antitoxin [Rhizomicrobium sp.]